MKTYIFIVLFFGLAGYGGAGEAVTTTLPESKEEVDEAFKQAKLRVVGGDE